MCAISYRRRSEFPGTALIVDRTRNSVVLCVCESVCVWLLARWSLNNALRRRSSSISALGIMYNVGIHIICMLNITFTQRALAKLDRIRHIRFSHRRMYTPDLRLLRLVSLPHERFAHISRWPTTTSASDVRCSKQTRFSKMRFLIWGPPKPKRWWCDRELNVVVVVVVQWWWCSASVCSNNI